MPNSEHTILSVADELRAENPAVVWLAGSFVSGEATPLSDIDLGVISAVSRSISFFVSDGRLVSVSRTTEAATRMSFRSPGLVGAAIPGWRDARLLFDPQHLGATLIAEARAWSWSDIDTDADVWCASQLLRASDEALKLGSAVARGDASEVARRRANLAVALPLLLSVSRRLLYGSERKLFSTVNAELGREWADAHRLAMGIGNDSLEQTVSALCWLFLFAARELESVLNSSEREVVRLAERGLRV